MRILLTACYSDFYRINDSDFVITSFIGATTGYTFALLSLFSITIQMMTPSYQSMTILETAMRPSH